MNELRVCDLFRGYGNVTIPPEISQERIFNICVSPGEVNEHSLLFLTEKVGDDITEFDCRVLKTEPAAIVASTNTQVNFCQCKKILVDNARSALSYALSNYYNINYSKMKIIGVTGTNGKTTTATLIYSILKECGYKTGFIGTGKIISGSKSLNGINYSMTTPDATTLYPALAQISKDGCEYAVMEVSSHSIALGKIAPIKFEYGIFTNLDNDHLDFHGNKEDYFKTKLRMFDNCKLGLFNLDDCYSRKAAELVPCKISTFGIIYPGDAYATEIDLELYKSTFYYREKNLIFKVNSHLTGAFNVYNSIAALRCVIDLGIKPCIAKKALEAIHRIDGRMEIIPGTVNAIIDYAHTPSAFYNCLKTIKSSIKQGQKLSVVFGCGGERDKLKRPEFGKYAEIYADNIIITEDNCRGEDFNSIAKDIARGMSSSRYVVIQDRESAIRYAFKNSRAGDVVALIGKGHEKYKIVGKEYIPFDERKIVQNILDELEDSYENNA